MSGDASRTAIAAVAQAMGPDVVNVVFVGGTVPALYGLPTALGIRPTDDVDCIAAVVLEDYYALADRLRARGFEPCTDLGAPICRSVCGGHLVDLMPTEPTAIGPTNAWYAEAFANAATYEVVPDVSVRAVTPIYFVATKLVAFHQRGAGSYGDSEDLEDIVLVLSGLPNLRAEIAAAASPVAEYVRGDLRELAAVDDFRYALRGYFVGDAAGDEQAEAFERWLAALCGAG